MAHELEIINGKASMFSVVKAPWHELGTILQSPPSVEEGLQHSGLDWQVQLKKLTTEDGTVVDHFANVRQSDGKVLGVVGPSYKPLQNIDAFRWFQPLLDSGVAQLETAGSLRGGKTVWVLAKIVDQKPLEIKDGDNVDRFMLLSNSHDGTRAVRCGFTPIRVVCQNTLSLACDNKKSSLIRLNHTKNLCVALDDLRGVMNTANSMFEATMDQYRKLARTTINKDDLRKYVKIVMEIPPEKPEADLSPKAIEKIETIISLCMNGIGNEGKTFWDAYNGITEFLGNFAGKTEDIRMESLWFGKNFDISKKALEIAIDMSA